MSYWHILTPDLISGFVTEALTSHPSAPDSGFTRIYWYNDDNLYYMNDDGIPHVISGGGGGGSGDEVKRLSTTTGVNLNTTGVTPLYTVPVGKSARITQVVFTVTSASSPVGEPEIGVGVAAGEDDILRSEPIIDLSTVDDSWVSIITGKARKASAGAVINLGIDTALTSGSLVVDVDLIGYLR